MHTLYMHVYTNNTTGRNVI